MGHVNERMCLIPALTYVSGSNGQRWLVCGSEDHAICVWNVKKGKSASNEDTGTRAHCCQRIPGNINGESDGHCDVVLCTHAHPLAPTIATGGANDDCTIKIWNDVFT